MPIDILFIHSAGSQSGEQGSSPFLKHLRQDLGSAYHILSPMMPEPDSPSYKKWKQKLDKQFLENTEISILVGHSLGGSVLLKYLSEQKHVVRATALFLVSVPYWGSKDWMLEEFILRENFANYLPENLEIYLYQSNDDEVVPIQHLSYYANAISKAKVRKIAHGGHTFKNGLIELVQDIKAIQLNNY